MFGPVLLYVLLCGLQGAVLLLLLAAVLAAALPLLQSPLRFGRQGAIVYTQELLF